MNGMTVADVMAYGAVSATADTPYRDLVDLIETRSVNAVPVVDRFSLVLGVVSASDLLHAVRVRGPVDRRSVADRITARIEAVDGVVSVESRVEWTLDDIVNAIPV